MGEELGMESRQKGLGNMEGCGAYRKRLIGYIPIGIERKGRC